MTWMSLFSTPKDHHESPTKKTFCDARHRLVTTYFVYLMLSDHFVWCLSSSSPSSTSPSASSTSLLQSPSVKHFKCDFQKFPEAGCADLQSTMCNKDTNLCVCRTGHPVNVNGRCFSLRDIDDMCVTTRQCSRIKAKCLDNAGEEVVSNEVTSDSSSSPDINTRVVIGTCKCPPGHFYQSDKKECSPKILGVKCLFHSDCSIRSHSYCDGKCKCKSGFFHDSNTDECRASLVTLCMFGYVFENGTQKCRPARDGTGGAILDGRVTGHSPLSSSLSALFWPIIAFFLVILLLKMLKEGMRRDCERAAASVAAGGHSSDHRRLRRNGTRSPHHHHRNHHHIGHPGRAYRHAYPSEFLPSLGIPTTPVMTRGDSSDGRSRSRPPEIIVLMPPPPYSATPLSVADPTSHHLPVPHEIGEEPPSYEEATRK